MKSLIYICIALFLSISAQAQERYEAPDFEAIGLAIQDSTSHLFYERLMERYLESDSTLTLEETRHLYYGYTFQEDFKPYRSSNYERELVPYYKKKKLNPKDYDMIIDLCNKAIAEFPFDIRQIGFLAHIYHLKGDEELSRKVSLKQHRIIDAIFSSGDGSSKETAFYVITIAHEYALMQVLGLEYTFQTLVDGCDRFELKSGEQIYFDVSCFFGK